MTLSMSVKTRSQHELDFAPTPVRTMVRNSDPSTSFRAAHAASDRSPTLKAFVLDAFYDCGTLNDGELEKLKRFEGVCANSLRKRRCDLVAEGVLIYAGIERPHPDRPRSSMLCWRIRQPGETSTARVREAGE